jgi:hypothetical protein
VHSKMVLDSHKGIAADLFSARCGYGFRSEHCF